MSLNLPFRERMTILSLEKLAIFKISDLDGSKREIDRQAIACAITLILFFLFMTFPEQIFTFCFDFSLWNRYKLTTVLIDWLFRIIRSFIFIRLVAACTIFKFCIFVFMRKTIFVRDTNFFFSISSVSRVVGILKLKKGNGFVIFVRLVVRRAARNGWWHWRDNGFLNLVNI